MMKLRKSLADCNHSYPDVFLMHSTLDEETYRDALLATTAAESSLTVLGVNAVLDLCLHKREVYNDHTRMSVLVTDWCSQPITNGIDCASLTRIVLEAAHLAGIMSS